MDRILVTGGMGFIGSNVVDALLSAGKAPVVFDYQRNRISGDGSRADFFLGDICDEVAVTQAMAHVDGWIHLAAVLGTQETIQNPRPAAISNITGGLNILEAAAQYDLPGVYICVGNYWMDNTYSITKTAVERFVTMFNKHRDTRVNMVRAVNAYGPGQVAAKPFGPGKVRKITPAFVCRALSRRPIEIYGDGRQISDMIHVRDLALVLVRALEAALAGKVFDHTVEAGPQDHCTVGEVADQVNSIVAEHTGSLVDIVNLPMRPGENPGDSVTADVSTLEPLGLDAKDFISLKDGMRETVQYFVDTKGRAWSDGSGKSR